MASNTDMNAFIAETAGRGERQRGLLDRLGGTTLDDDRRRELNEAMIAAETAIRQGNDAGREIAEIRLDRVLDEAREVHKAAQPPAVSWDGGVRRPMPRPPSMNQLIRETARPY